MKVVESEDTFKFKIGNGYEVLTIAQNGEVFGQHGLKASLDAIQEKIFVVGTNLKIKRARNA